MGKHCGTWTPLLISVGLILVILLFFFFVTLDKSAGAEAHKWGNHALSYGTFLVAFLIYFCLIYLFLLFWNTLPVWRATASFLFVAIIAGFFWDNTKGWILTNRDIFSLPGGFFIHPLDARNQNKLAEKQSLDFDGQLQALKQKSLLELAPKIHFHFKTHGYDQKQNPILVFETHDTIRPALKFLKVVMEDGAFSLSPEFDKVAIQCFESSYILKNQFIQDEEGLKEVQWGTSERVMIPIEKYASDISQRAVEFNASELTRSHDPSFVLSGSNGPEGHTLWRIKKDREMIKGPHIEDILPKTRGTYGWVFDVVGENLFSVLFTISDFVSPPKYSSEFLLFDWNGKRVASGPYPWGNSDRSTFVRKDGSLVYFHMHLDQQSDASEPFIRFSDSKGREDLTSGQEIVKKIWALLPKGMISIAEAIRLRDGRFVLVLESRNMSTTMLVLISADFKDARSLALF